MHKAVLGWPILLLGASCVPAAGTVSPLASAGTRAAASGSYAAPGFQSLSLPLATEEPPPPEKLAEEIAVGSPARPFDIGGASGGDVQSALNCLTAAVYYEARSESEGGQRAVAQVVLNRVRHPAFPKTVCGVVYQGSNRTTGCQFSFTCDGSLAHARERGAWERAQRIAEQALAGYVYAPVGLATHYHTTAIRPWWAAAMAKAVTIGSHIFYRWHGEWGDPRSFRRPYVGAEALAQSAAGEAEAEAPAPEGRVEIAAGVSVHRGAEPAMHLVTGDDGSAVRIHRSGGVLASASDVRVHRGSPPAAAEPAAEAAPDAAPSSGDSAPVAVR
ncbi:MAG: cell wall hydrolase [Alphaproteobacteria bacterium]|nr:cell wall hydrolase [Alphaproteobacteria bacterium]MBV9373042.1 cell wall hydrolase [Alphaproteobacteria bacterium]MBV9902925.1 cell wall hydrolase [Alphaproteobacteria bacterium]